LLGAKEPFGTASLGYHRIIKNLPIHTLKEKEKRPGSFAWSFYNISYMGFLGMKKVGTLQIGIYQG
jgi:hypothetical protein